MNETQLDEHFQLTEDVIKYGSLRMHLASDLSPRTGLIRTADCGEEWTAEERERFFQKLNTPYGL